MVQQISHINQTYAKTLPGTSSAQDAASLRFTQLELTDI
jgi:hypothetical protein